MGDMYRIPPISSLPEGGYDLLIGVIRLLDNIKVPTNVLDLDKVLHAMGTLLIIPIERIAPDAFNRIGEYRSAFFKDTDPIGADVALSISFIAALDSKLKYIDSVIERFYPCLVMVAKATGADVNDAVVTEPLRIKASTFITEEIVKLGNWIIDHPQHLDGLNVSDLTMG